jgi:hypothetical protein
MIYKVKKQPPNLPFLSNMCEKMGIVEYQQFKKLLAL